MADGKGRVDLIDLPRGDRLLDHGGQHPPLPSGDVPDPGREVVILEQDIGESLGKAVEILVRHQYPGAELVRYRSRAADNGLFLPGHFGDDLAVRRLAQLLLAGEVPVYRPLRDSGLGGDSADSGPADAVTGGLPDGGGDDFFPAARSHR